jgi:two-component system, OmpR family, phosphate regulon sensor histidine kinase PhoR
MATESGPEMPSSAARRYDEVLEGISEGIVLFDANLKPTLVNSAAVDMLGLPQRKLPARLSPEVVAVARRGLSEGQAEEVLKLWYPVSSTLKVRALRFRDGGGVLIVVKDITDETLAQQIRSEFVAHASHELKSPVAGLQTLASAISHAVHDDPEIAERFSGKLVAEADRLGRLISDLLDLSRLEDPARVPDEPVDISDVTRAEVERVEPEAAEKAMTVDTDIAPEVWVRGDAQQLGVLVRNLLENAVRYTPEGGTLAIEVLEDRADAVIRVTDDGVGIPLEAQARLFERFYCVDRARSRDRGGTGLGLAIVKHVTELHQGTVEVESELGRGSTFTVRIPAAACAEPRPAPSE